METKKLLLILSFIVLWGCSSEQATSESYDEISMTKMDYEDEDAQNHTARFTPPILSTLAGSTKYDGKRRFIRTARIKMKADDVLGTLHKIENVIIANEGVITKSDLKNNESIINEERLSKDSVLNTIQTSLTASLDLRVSQHLLDSSLRAILPFASAVDYRIVDAREVNFDIVSNKLQNERAKKKSTRIAQLVGNRSHKLEDLIEAEESIDSANESADDAIISNYKLEDEIDFSNIYISLYQDPIVSKKTVYDEEYTEAYYNSPSANLKQVASEIWKIICGILLFLLATSIVALPIVIVVYIIKYFRRRRKLKKAQEQIEYAAFKSQETRADL